MRLVSLRVEARQSTWLSGISQRMASRVSNVSADGAAVYMNKNAAKILSVVSISFIPILYFWPSLSFKIFPSPWDSVLLENGILRKLDHKDLMSIFGLTVKDSGPNLSGP